MNSINLNALRDRAYKTACDHGFHDEELSNAHLFCLVISELMEAVEADRKNRHFDKEKYKIGEYADAVIRLFDLAGLRNISLEIATKDIGDCIDDMAESFKDETFTESIYAISTLPVIYNGLYDFPTTINDMVLSIFGLAKHLEIDLLWHIEQKMKYNQLRDKMHGKKY